MKAITPDELARARELRAQGRNWSQIGRAIGCGLKTIRYHLDPAYAAKRRAYDASLREMRRYGEDTNGPPCPEALKERDDRLSAWPTLDNVLTGTPVKGRSALDGWVQRGASSNSSPRRSPGTPAPQPR